MTAERVVIARFSTAVSPGQPQPTPRLARHVDWQARTGVEARGTAHPRDRWAHTAVPARDGRAGRERIRSTDR